MKILIRHGVFETNSSSTHSLCVVKEECAGHWYDTGWLNNEGDIEVDLGEFGWGLEVYKHFEDKLSYLMTVINDLDKDTPKHQTFLENVNRAIRECIPEFKGILVKNNEYGYIDHQSWGVADDTLWDTDKIKDFLFNSKSLLVIDNDNR